MKSNAQSLSGGSSHQQQEERLGTGQGPWRSRLRALAPCPNPRGKEKEREGAVRVWERKERGWTELKRKEVEGEYGALGANCAPILHRN